MRLGMMQPYFFPYAGYFSLIQATDQWVVFDTAQYCRRHWVNRNRILSDKAEQWTYLRIPVTHAPQQTAIRDMQVDDRQDWQRTILTQLEVYRRRGAPEYVRVVSWLKSVLCELPDPSDRCLSSRLIHFLRSTCEFIGLPFRYCLFSRLNLTLPEDMGPGDWALETSRRLKARCYINAPGGRSLFDPRQFSEAGIELLILEPTLPSYSQGSGSFIPALSILDLLMWNSVSDVHQLLKAYSLTAITPSTAGDQPAESVVNDVNAGTGTESRTYHDP